MAVLEKQIELAITQQPQRGLTQEMSYAAVTKKNPTANVNPAVLEAVTIRPKEGNSAKDIVEMMKKEMNGGALFDATVKTTRGAFVVLESGTKEDIKKVQASLLTEEKLKSKGTVRKSSRSCQEIKITQIEQDLSISEIKELVKNNKHEDYGEEIEVLFTRKDPYRTQTAFVAVPREAHRPVLDRQRTKVGWSRCPMEENIRVKRCSKCLTYGLSAKICTSEENFCPYSADTHFGGRYQIGGLGNCRPIPRRLLLRWKQAPTETQPEDEVTLLSTLCFSFI